MEQRPIQILFVDDCEDDYVLTRELLEDVSGQCYQLDWIDSYAEALEAIKAQCHDLYLVDYVLGRENGLDLLREVNADGTAPIVFLTGQGNFGVDVEAMKAGAADYVEKKALTPELLERTIRYALERYRNEQKLSHLAQYDQLTGLPGRALFRDRLHQSIAMAQRESCCMGLMFLDLDRFKYVNDTLGHAIGDGVLRSVAKRFGDCIRKSDTVARLGGDEFVILLPRIPFPSFVATVARRIQEKMLTSLRVDGQEIYVNASIGMAVYPSDAEDEEELLRCADAAMYRAKEQQGGQCRFFSPEMNQASRKHYELGNQLRKAWERGEFKIRYQPQFDLETRQVTTLEAFLHWDSPQRAGLSQVEFFSALEECGVLQPAREWVLRTACHQLKVWQAQGLATCRISVNVSGRQLQHEQFVSTVERVLREAELEPHWLQLEINESTITQDLSRVAKILEHLDGIGVDLVIDQFGGGNFALSTLRQLPIKKLKIGSSFTSGIGREESDEDIVRAIIALAQSMKMQVVAAGVDTSAQLEFLRNSGCETGQGLEVGVTLPADEVPSLFS